MSIFFTTKEIMECKKLIWEHECGLIYIMMPIRNYIKQIADLIEEE